jgi:CHASE3 domain sensor protein
VDKISFHKKVVIVLISVLLVVLASAFFVNRAIQNIVHEVSEASKPDQRLVLLKGMMYDIADAENSVKSYSLTKNESYLDDYNLEINEVNYKLLQLQEIGDEGSDLANNLPKIDSLVNEKFNVLDELLLVQSKRSADVILQKVLEKVDGINEKQ